MRRHALCLVLLAAAAGVAAARKPKDPPLTFTAERHLTLPRAADSFRFAVIGDSGTGSSPQYQLAERMVQFWGFFPFDLVLMLGDNLYGGEAPADFRAKFEKPYQVLLDSGVKFRAILGNHDNPNSRHYKEFNMGGERYYSFAAPRQSVRFIGLDSNYMDPEQLAWLEKTLAGAKEDWRICFFHHPLYSSGRKHGSNKALRSVLEPVLLRGGVQVVLAGHEHFYERIRPQKGIVHFISGAAGQLRVGNIAPTSLTARGFDRGRHFVLFEVVGDELHYQAVSVGGETVDSGVVRRGEVEREESKEGTRK